MRKAFLFLFVFDCTTLSLVVALPHGDLAQITKFRDEGRLMNERFQVVCKETIDLQDSFAKVRCGATARCRECSELFLGNLKQFRSLPELKISPGVLQLNRFGSEPIEKRPGLADQVKKADKLGVDHQHLRRAEPYSDGKTVFSTTTFSNTSDTGAWS